MKRENDMDIILHVGLPKTGSTFLARGLFKQSPYVRLIENPLMSVLLKEEVVNVISNDGLCGTPWINDARKETDPYLLADRLCRLFPNAKIIIGTREKQDWLNSLYRHYVKYGGHLDFNGFYDNVLDKSFLDVRGYIRLMQHLFSYVYVAKFEDLKENPKQFVKQICYFTEIPVPDIEYKIVNQGWNKKQIKLGLMFNKYFKSRFNPDGFLLYRWRWYPKTLVHLMGGFEWID